MYIDFNMPPAPEIAEIVSAYWSRYFFVGSPSGNYQINTLANTFVRVTEAAIVEYEFGTTAVREFWSESRALHLSSMHRAISHFETSLADVHRSIEVFRRLRNHKERDRLAIYLAAYKPGFVSDAVATSFREIRNTIHHLGEKVLNGQISEGQPIALKPDGSEIPHPTEAGQTIKIIDRLVIGPHEITFVDLVATFGELSAAAAYMAGCAPHLVQRAASN
ncbi:MAG: hypothetical protein EPN61_04655 [Burkholderiaceae bacterium]|nr:MAG: hypothetical protein EPN61_04655 [Burkholderiaceae bacterium]